MGKTYKLSLFPGKNLGSNRTTYALQIDAFYSTDAFDAKFGADMPYVVFGNSAWSWKAKHLGPRSKQNKGIVQVTWDTPDDVEITTMFEVFEFIDAFNADHTNLRCSIHEELKESQGFDRRDYVSPLGITLDELIVMRDLGLYQLIDNFEYCRNQGDWEFSGQQQELAVCSTSTINNEALVDLIQMTVCSDFVHCTVRFSNYKQVVASLERGKDTFRFLLTTYGGHRAGSLYVSKEEVLKLATEMDSIVMAVATIASKRWPKASRDIDESFEVNPAKMEEVKTLAELGIEKDTLYARMNAMHDVNPGTWLSVTSSGDGESFVGVTVHDTQTNTPKKLTEYTGHRGEGMDSKLGNTTKLMMSRRYDSPNPMLTQKVPIYDLDVLAFYGREHDAEMMADDDCFENGLPGEDHNVTVRWRYKKMLHGLEDLERAVSDFRDSNIRTTDFSRTVS